MKVHENVKKEDGTVDSEILDPDFKMKTSGLQYLYNELHKKFMMSPNLEFTSGLKQISNFRQGSNETVLKSLDRFLRLVNDFARIGGKLEEEILVQYFLDGSKLDKDQRIMLSTHLMQKYGVEDSKSVKMDQLKTVLEIMFRFENEALNENSSETFQLRGQNYRRNRYDSPRPPPFRQYSGTNYRSGHQFGKRNFSPNRRFSRSYSPSYRQRNFRNSRSYSPNRWTRSFSKGRTHGKGKGRNTDHFSKGGKSNYFGKGKGKGRGHRKGFSTNSVRSPSPFRRSMNCGLLSDNELVESSYRTADASGSNTFVKDDQIFAILDRYFEQSEHPTSKHAFPIC